jgi:co-chaperonin GroES (HSP10)
MEKSIAVFGNRVLTRPLNVLTKQQKKKSQIIAPENRKEQSTRQYYDEHKFQAEVIKIGLVYRLRTFFMPKKHKINKGDVIYHIGGDGFPIIQDDKDYLVLETKRVVGKNEKGKQGYGYLTYKDM